MTRQAFLKLIEPKELFKLLDFSRGLAVEMLIEIWEVLYMMLGLKRLGRYIIEQPRH